LDGEKRERHTRISRITHLGFRETSLLISDGEGHDDDDDDGDSWMSNVD